jgi:HEAT repeat protein
MISSIRPSWESKNHTFLRVALTLLLILFGALFAQGQVVTFPTNAEIAQLKHEALAILSEILKSENESDRLSAATILVRHGDQDAVALLIDALLHDKAPFVRRAAAEGLARFQAEEAAPALRESALNDDTSSIRWAAGVALILWSLDERWLIEHLLQEPATLAAAAVSLQDSANLQKFPEALWPFAQSAFVDAFPDRETFNVVERAAMLKSLARMKTTGPISLLRRTLSDTNEDPFVRGAAAFALGLLSVKEAVPDLIASLESDLEALQLAAATALGQLADSRALVPLSKTLQEARMAEVRTSAAEALAAFGVDAIPALAASLQNDRSPLVRQAAQYALANIGGSEAARAVLVFLDSGFLQGCEPSACNTLALETLIALVRLGQGAVALQLMTATLASLRDMLPFFFIFAESNLVRAVSEVGRAQPEMFSLLLKDLSPFVRALGIASLSRVQGCLAREQFLIYITPTEDSFVRRAALEGFSPCAGPEDILIVAPYLGDRDRRVRAASLAVLAQRGDARALALLRGAIGAQSVSVKLDAAGAALAYVARIAELNKQLSCSRSAQLRPDRILECMET